VVKFDVISNL